MKASDLMLEELVDFSEGRLHLHGRRLVIHDIHSFGQLRKDLLEMVGNEHARRILTRFGYSWGQADAAAMHRIFDWDDLGEWVAAGPRLHTLQGVVRTVVKRLEIDASDARFHCEVVWHDSGEAQEHLAAVGEAQEPVCWMLVGYASGYASFCMKTDVYFVETACRATGDRTCRAEGRDRAAWGKDIESSLPYFEADDIQAKILNLTQEIRRQNRQIRRQKRELARLQPPVQSAQLVEVRSPAFQRILELSNRVARYDSSVLITGESGVGKERLARYIHEASPRSAQPFLAVNCGALPETLLESELFGHTAGAFTGATGNRHGVFEEAAKGTLFLDEIGDVSSAMQVKLLRVLQEREIVRVGENIPRPIDVRVIAATNRDLQKAIRESRFREDLYYRLGVVEIEVPPLRERPDDFLPLARHFVQRLRKTLNLPNLRLDATCLDLLQKHNWPGNVRELENAMERAAVLSREGVIYPSCLPPAVIEAGMADTEAGYPASVPLATIEKRHIRAVLEHTAGNRSHAARILGISTTTLWRKLKSGSPGQSNIPG